MPTEGWPPDVKPISFEQLEHLGVSTKNQTLYWDGKPILVEKMLALTKMQLSIACVGALGALASGIVATLEFLKKIMW